MNNKKSMLIAVMLSAVFSHFAMGQTSPSVRDRVVPVTDPAESSEGSKVPITQNFDATEERIKLAVTQYFDWLNRAEKDGALQASSMKPLSRLRESQTFLSAKNEVLEAIEYSNQLNGVKIENQSSKLTFRRISFSKKGNTAEAEVAERYERKYEYFAEPAIGETLHTIALQYQGGQWEILDDSLLNATDAPPKRGNKAALMETIRQEANLRRATEQHLLLSAGITQQFLAEERARLAKQGLDARAIEERLVLIVNEKMNSSSGKSSAGVVPDAITPLMYTNRTYNRAAAKAYIDRWWSSRNSVWGNFDNFGGDCTNWISQIINAGGVPEDKAGSYQWYWDNMNAPRTSPPYTRSASWTGVDELWSYIQGNTANNGPNGPQGQSWTGSSGLTQVTTGDFIQLKDSSGKWFHTYGVYDGNWVNLKPWWCPWCADDWRYKVRITSHYMNRYHDDLDSAASGYPTRRYVHITGWYQP